MHWPERRAGVPQQRQREGLPEAGAARCGDGAGHAQSAQRGAAPASAESSGSFPRVDSATQKSRDSERRRVLEAELSEEERKLQALQAEYNNGQPERQGNERNYQKYLDRTAQLKSDIERSQANVESIRRELSNLKE
ncbi:hypothetical protein ACEQUB_01980 [Ralstonia syzygii]